MESSNVNSSIPPSDPSASVSSIPPPIPLFGPPTIPAAEEPTSPGTPGALTRMRELLAQWRDVTERGETVLAGLEKLAQELTDEMLIVRKAQQDDHEMLARHEREIQELLAAERRRSQPG